MGVARIDGLEIAYERAGEGPPLLLAHGAAGDGRSWEPQLEGLAGELTVVAWDEPGAGGSSDLPEGFGLKDFARCLVALIDDVGLGPAHVGGLSWGGMIAQEAARLAPDRVATLILADTYAGWRGSLPAEECRRRIDGLVREIESPSPDPAAAFPGLFAGEPPRRSRELVTAMAAATRRSSLRSLLAMADLDLSDGLERIAVPTLLVWGEQDVRSPLAVARQFEREIPAAELVTIPDCGHLSNLERPEAFNDAVLEFCRRHTPA